MRSSEKLCLAALVSLMAMAFVVSSTAMAENTQLCTTDQKPCGSPITSVHELSVGKARFLSINGTECNVLFSSTSVGSLGSPQVIKGHFTYADCGFFCSVTEKPGTTATITVLKEGHETAKDVFTEMIHTSCAGIECDLDIVGVAGTAKGPLLSLGSRANGEISLQSAPFTAILGGVLCPASGELDITLTPLVATYISS